MSFLGIGKNKKEGVKAVAPKVTAKIEKKPKAVKVPKVVSDKSFKAPSRSVIIRPHITEKAGMLSENGVYSFEVTKESTKPEIASAIATLYKVTPVKVSIVKVMPKARTLRGKQGFSAGGKKAYVRLKAGDKIEFI